MKLGTIRKYKIKKLGHSVASPDRKSMLGTGGLNITQKQTKFFWSFPI